MFQGLLNEITLARHKEEELGKEIKRKENELAFVEKDISSKLQRFERATNTLFKLLKYIRTLKEPPKYKLLAQVKCLHHLLNDFDKTCEGNLFPAFPLWSHENFN